MFGECRALIVKQKLCLKGMLILLNEHQAQSVTALGK
jgi:hypothetical protein